MPFSSNISESRLFEAKSKNLPFWYSYLSTADKAKYLSIFTTGPQEDTVPGLYVIDKTFYGLVSNTASTWWDLQNPGALGVGTSTNFPSSIHAGISGTVSFVSASGNDTSTAGTGLRSIFVYGYDGATTTVKAEYVQLNGAGAVVTSNNYSVMTFIAAETGTLNTNAGIVTASGGATVMATMPAEAGYSNLSVIMIPAGYKFVLEEANFTGPETLIKGRWGFLGTNNSILDITLGVQSGAWIPREYPCEREYMGAGALFFQNQSVTSASQLVSARIKGYLTQI